MYFHQRFIPGLAIYSYIVGDETTGEAVLVDPTRDVEPFLALAEQAGLRIGHVLETHVHADFVSGARELKARLGDDVIVHASGLGGEAWTPAYTDRVVADGDEVIVGSLRLEAMHTPGHTPEHLAWLLFDTSRSADTPWLAFTGDFAFVGDVGRPDLLGEGARRELAHQLYESVFGRLPRLPDFLEIFPGHGAGSLCGKAIGSRGSSTLGYERRFNAALAAKPEERWIADLMQQMPLSPPYFARMKRINQQGPPVIGLELPGQRPLGARAVRQRMDGNAVIVDVRSKDAFATAHVPGSISIPLGATLPTWAGWVLPYEQPLLLVADSPAQARQATTHLLRVGFDDVEGYLDGGIDAWHGAGLDTSSVATMPVRTLHDRARAVTVVDVRTEREFLSGHVGGALHIHAGRVVDNAHLVPRDRPVAVICGTGFRGSIVASLLERAGYNDVSNVLGGMSAWRAAGLPVEKSADCGNGTCRAAAPVAT